MRLHLLGRLLRISRFLYQGPSPKNRTILRILSIASWLQCRSDTSIRFLEASGSSGSRLDRFPKKHEKGQKSRFFDPWIFPFLGSFLGQITFCKKCQKRQKWPKRPKTSLPQGGVDFDPFWHFSDLGHTILSGPKLDTGVPVSGAILRFQGNFLALS